MAKFCLLQNIKVQEVESNQIQPLLPGWSWAESSPGAQEFVPDWTSVFNVLLNAVLVKG